MLNRYLPNLVDIFFVYSFSWFCPFLVCRAEYNPKHDLLDQEFLLKGKWYQRKDVEVSATLYVWRSLFVCLIVLPLIFMPSSPYSRYLRKLLETSDMLGFLSSIVVSYIYIKTVQWTSNPINCTYFSSLI